MLIKMLTRYASPKRSCPPGGVIDLPKKEAESLIEGGYAVAKNPPIVKLKPVEKPKPPGKTPEERAAEILAAVRIVLELKDASKLTASGAPKVEVLAELLGFDVTLAERNRAFEQIS